MIDIIIILISFFATIIAIKGETWKNVETGIKKITLTGYFTFVLALLALIFGYIKNHKDSIITQNRELMLKSISENAMSTQDTILGLRVKLDSARFQLTSMQMKIDAYEHVLNKIGGESERQPQWTFLNYYNLEPNKIIEMPNRVHSGSLLKFVGICDGLILKYGTKRVEIPSFHYSNPLEIPIMGQSGVSYQWSVQNISSSSCEFKIYIFSTPRSRSSSASWIEEGQEQKKQDLFFLNMLQYIFNGENKDKLNVDFLNVKFVENRDDLEMISEKNKKIQPKIMFYAQYGYNATSESDYFFSNLKRDFFMFLENNNYRTYSVEDKTWMSDINPDKYWINKLYKSTNGNKSFYFRYEEEKTKTMGYCKFIIGK